MVREISYGEAVNRRETNLNLSRAQKELIVKAILGKNGSLFSESGDSFEGYKPLKTTYKPYFFRIYGDTIAVMNPERKQKFYMAEELLKFAYRNR